MKSISMLLGLCLLSVVAYGQGNKSVKEVVADGVDPMGVLDVYPKFPGGEEQMYRYIGEHIQYPSVARRMGIEGRVYIQFVVDKTGKVKDVLAVRGIGGGCDEEAIRVVKSMPDWEPAVQDGKPVSVKMIVPISYTLDDVEVEEKKTFWQRIFGRGK